MVGGARAARRRRRPERLAVHLAAVPRVGLPLHPRGRAAGRAEAGDAARVASPRRRRSSSSRSTRSRCGPRCPRWCGGSASTPTATTTTPRRCESVAFGGSPSADELQRMIHDTFPNVSAPPRTPTASPRRRRWPRRSAGRTPSTSPRPSGPPVPTVSVKIVDDAGQRGRHRRDRRGVHHRPDPDGRLLEQARGHRRGDHATAGCTPATSATSTRTASSSSPTARRT